MDCKLFSIIVIFVLCAFFIGGCCWSYTLNFWFDYNEMDIHINYWLSGLVGVIPIVGQCSIPAYLVTWIFDSITM